MPVHNKNNDVVTVAVHSGDQRELIDRMKASTNEKTKGALMIDRQKDLFGFTSYKEIENLVDKEFSSEHVRAKTNKISWERDRYGNPTRPFR